jgi:hypothetical protein
VTDRYTKSTGRSARLISGSQDGAGAIRPLSLWW